MEQRLSLVTLGVRDLDAARQFYERLGWRSTGPTEEVVFFQAGGVVVGLWGRSELAADTVVEDSGGWGGITLAHNVGSREAVDALLEEAGGAGGTVRRPGAPTEWGGYGGVLGSRRPLLGGRSQPVLDSYSRRSHAGGRALEARGGARP